MAKKAPLRKRRKTVVNKGDRPGEREAREVAIGKALELRLAGKTYREIGEALDVCAFTASRYVSAAVAEVEDENADRAARLAARQERERNVQLARCDAMLSKLWARLEAHEPGRPGDVTSAQVAGQIIKVLDRQAKLLGLDAPTKVSPTDPTGKNPYLGMTRDQLLAEARAVLAEVPDADDA